MQGANPCIGIVEDKKVKEQMGRRILRPNYDNLAEVIDENLPPEVKIKFIQELLSADSVEEAVLKLAKTKEQPKELLESIQRNL
ncbi:MAG: hypothetical protein ACE5PV_17510 [Candidatus Poribacteria bacterium]